MEPVDRPASHSLQSGGPGSKDSAPLGSQKDSGALFFEQRERSRTRAMRSARYYHSEGSHFRYLKYRVARYFHFEERRTTFTAEIRGGFVTFLTMSYILLVNPQILSYWIGGDGESVKKQRLADIKEMYMNNIASSTALVCGVGTFLVGVFTKLPFSVGPGMGLNTFFASMILMAESYSEFSEAQRSWSVAVTATFVSGLLLFLLSVLNVSHRLVEYLPAVLKSSILVGIGLYQAFVGLRTMKIIESDPVELLTFVSHYNLADKGTTGTIAQILFGLSLLITSSLYVCQVNGAILIGIMSTTIICWVASVGGVTFPVVPVQIPEFATTFWTVNFPLFYRDLSAISSCGSFILIILFDVAGVMFGVQTLARELTRQQKQREGVEYATALDVTDTESAVDDAEAQEGESGNHGTSGSNASKAIIGDEQAVSVRPAAVSPRYKAGGLPTRHDVEEPDSDDDDAEEKVSLIMQDVMADDASLLNQHGDLIAPWEARRAYAIIGLSSMLSATVGSSPCIVFLECIAGVASGARTGFSSVVCALLFFVSLPFTPVFRSVPPCASAPALVIVGCFMMSSAADIPWSDHQMAMPAFITIILMPFTASITPGIVGGILAYAFFFSVGWLERKYQSYLKPGESGAVAKHDREWPGGPAHRGGDSSRSQSKKSGEFVSRKHNDEVFPGSGADRSDRTRLLGRYSSRKGAASNDGSDAALSASHDGHQQIPRERAGWNDEGVGAESLGTSMLRGGRATVSGRYASRTPDVSGAHPSLFYQPMPHGLRGTATGGFFGGVGSRSNRSAGSDVVSVRSSDKAWAQHTPHVGAVGFRPRNAELVMALNTSLSSSASQH